MIIVINHLMVREERIYFLKNLFLKKIVRSQIFQISKKEICVQKNFLVSKMIKLRKI